MQHDQQEKLPGLELPLGARLGACLALLAQAMMAQAQGVGEEREGGAESRQLRSVTVTARRAIEQRFFAAGSMVVVDRKDIEELGANSVGDVLRQLPGVQVTPSSDGGIEIRMRGMDKNATQLLIDGQRIGAGKSQLPLDQLPAELIERIEVVRAPTAEFSRATGGTLNLVLRQATVRRETTLRLTDNHVWGRNAAQLFFSRTGPLAGQAQSAPTPTSTRAPTGKSQTAAASPDAGDPARVGLTAVPELPELPTQAPDKPWSYFLAASRTGYVLGSDTRRESASNDANQSGTQTLSNSQGRYRTTELTLIPRVTGGLGRFDELSLRSTLSRTHQFGEVGSSTASTAQPADATSVTRAQEAYDRVRNYLQGAADWTHRFPGSKLESTLSASEAREAVSRLGQVTQDGVAGASPYSFVDDRRDRVWQASSKLTGTADTLLWSLGAETESRRLRVGNSTAGTGLGAGVVPTGLNLSATVRRDVLWGQNEWELPAKTTLTAGLRGETLTTESADSNLLIGQRRNLLQPSVHVRTPLSEDLQWRANLARVTRNPGVWDLIDRTWPSLGVNSMTNPDYSGNPQLRPEVAWTIDSGFERRLPSQGQVGINLFVRKIKDSIGSSLNLVGNRWLQERSNVGNASVWGLEADVKTGLTAIGWGSDWSLSGNATLLQSRLTSGEAQGSRIPGQSRYLLNTTLAKPLRRTGGLFGGATLSITGPAQLNTSAVVSGQERARAALDVYLGGVMPSWGYWRVGVYNIGNAAYVRERNYISNAGSANVTTAQDRSSMTLTPRLYLTAGTEF